MELFPFLTVRHAQARMFASRGELPTLGSATTTSRGPLVEAMSAINSSS
jgi:hypothetical protein